MTELDGALTELARVRSGSEPIVSLYLDVRWSDEQQRERVCVFVRDRARHELGHYLPGSPGRDGLARTLARIGDYVAGLADREHDEDRNGLALFACDGLGLWRAFLFRRSFRNELCLDAIPRLRQLARLADDFEPAIVVMPSQAGADLYEVSLGELAAEATLRGFVPRRDQDVFNPGAARPGQHFERQEKDVRHQDAFIRRNWRAAAGEVQKLHDRRPRSHLVLVGTSETVAAFERELPERLRARVIARVPRPREWESGNGARRGGVVTGAAQLIAAHERAREAQVVEAVVGEALRGGVAVVGPDDVISAANQGRIHRLVIEEDFHRSAWRCDRCGSLGITDAETCPYDGDGLRSVLDLGEELIARTIGADGEIEVVAHANRLHSYDGVAAFLRQTAQTGLRGGPPGWPSAPGANQGA